MKILTVGTLKGGVGKSNFTFNLGGILAEQGKKVLLIDIDPQSNLSLNVGVDITKTRYTIKNILENRVEIEKVIVKSPIKELNLLDIITSDLLLYETEVKLMSKLSREYILARYFKENIEKLKEYDYILIDTNPSFSLTNQNAFLVADEIILLSDVSLNGIQGAELFISLYKNIIKDLGIENNVHTLILNNLDKRLKLSKELIEYCKSNDYIKDLLLDTIIYNIKCFKDVEIEHLPINLLYPNSKQHMNYIDLLNEIQSKILN